MKKKKCAKCGMINCKCKGHSKKKYGSGGAYKMGKGGAAKKVTKTRRKM